jgi:hypothetical protein
MSAYVLYRKTHGAALDEAERFWYCRGTCAALEYMASQGVVCVCEKLSGYISGIGVKIMEWGCWRFPARPHLPGTCALNKVVNSLRHAFCNVARPGIS